MNLSISQNAESSWVDKFGNTHIRPLQDCLEILEAGDWSGCSDLIRNYQKPRTNKPKGIEENIAALIHKTVKNAVDDFQSLSELAIVNPDYLNIVGKAAGSQTYVLIELIRKFDQLYTEAKSKINCLDFADLEHIALKLLTDEKSSQDKPVPSETAIALQQRYKYIFVDEYQDINAVQKRILQLLSPGGNILQVQAEHLCFSRR